jgi:outer membrane murein-binding lipoprotein Lpp
MQVTAAQRMNSLNLMAGSTDESVDLYAQAFGSFVLNSQQLNSHCNHLDHHTKEEMDDLQAKIAELESSVEGLRSEAAVQIMEMEKMKLEIDQSQVSNLTNILKKWKLYFG